MDPASSSSHESYSRSVAISTSTDTLSEIASNTEWHGFDQAVIKFKGGNRSRSLTHFSLKREYHDKRSQSADALLQTHPHANRVKEKMLHVFERVRAKLSSSEPNVPDEDVSLSSSASDIEQLEEPKKSVEGLTRDSMSLCQEPLKKFRFGNTNLSHEPYELNQLLSMFVDDENNKIQACQKSRDIAKVREGLIQEIIDCEEEMGQVKTNEARQDLKNRRKQAHDKIKQIAVQDGESLPLSHGKVVGVDDLRKIEREDDALDYHVNLMEGFISVTFKSAFAILGSPHRYEFVKTGEIREDQLGLYVLKEQHFLTRLSS